MKSKIENINMLCLRIDWSKWKNSCHCEPRRGEAILLGLLRRLRLLAMTPFINRCRIWFSLFAVMTRMRSGLPLFSLLFCSLFLLSQGDFVFAQAKFNVDENIKCLKDLEAALGTQAKKIEVLEGQLKAGENANRQLVNRLNELSSEYSGFLEEVIEDKRNGLEKFNKAKAGFSDKKNEFVPVQEAVGILFPSVKTNEEALMRQLKEMRGKFAQDKEALEAKVFSLELELELKHKEWERQLAEKEKNENDLENSVSVLEKEKSVLEKTVEAQSNREAYYEVVSKEKENLERLLELTRESYAKQAGSLYYYLGLAYTQAKIYRDAIQAYAKSLEYEPDSPEVHCNLGLLYAYQGNNPSKMLYHLREALRINPQIENREVLKDLIEKEKDKEKE